MGVSSPIQGKERVTMLERKTVRVWFCATLLICAVCCGGVLKAQEKQPSVPIAIEGREYHIGVGDIVQIDVWRQPEIKRTALVRPDGKISLPLLNDVQAAGLTAMQLAGAVRDGLTKYLWNPQVTVTVTFIAGEEKFFVTPPQMPLMVTPPAISPELKQKCCAA
jgi:hypothetical protein